MKNEYVIPNALAATTAIIFVACRVLVGLFPDISFAIATSWFHGIGFSQLNGESLTVSSFILGIISSTVTAWVIGLIFVKVYKLLVK